MSKPATHLHLALELRHPLAVLTLTRLEDCDQPDSNGTTPLHLAVQT